jgi:hypothetical protein
MSWEDYNRHARLGPLAGLPKNVPEKLGQDAYYEALKYATGVNSENPGPWVPHAQTEPPRWMMQHAFKRGLAFFFGAQAVALALGLFAPARSDLVEFALGICALVELAGMVLMVCGVLNFITRRRRGGKTGAAPSSQP